MRKISNGKENVYASSAQLPPSKDRRHQLKRGRLALFQYQFTGSPFKLNVLADRCRNSNYLGPTQIPTKIPHSQGATRSPPLITRRHTGASVWSGLPSWKQDRVFNDLLSNLNKHRDHIFFLEIVLRATL